MTVFVGKVGQQLDVEGVVQHIVSPPGLKDTYPTDTGPRFFYKLKTDRGERVTLLSVEPSGLKRSVVVTAEARDASAMLAHLRALQDDGRLRHITLVGHQREVQVAGSPLRYRLQGEW